MLHVCRFSPFALAANSAGSLEITTNPADKTVNKGGSALLTAAAVAKDSTGTAYPSNDLTYQWYTATSPSGPWTLIPGANSDTYNAPANTNGTYYYYVEVTSSALSASNTQYNVSVTMAGQQ